MSVDVSYYSFSEKRADAAWKEKGGSDIIALKEKYPSMDEGELLFSVRELDLNYGAVSNDYFEDPKLEDFVLEAIAENFQLTLEDGVPSRAEWLRFLEEVKIKRMEGVVEILKKDFSEETASALISDYLIAIKPVLKDLKENPEAVFCRSYGGDGDYPKWVEVLLKERAKRHLEDYK